MWQRKREREKKKRWSENGIQQIYYSAIWDKEQVYEQNWTQLFIL